MVSVFLVKLHEIEVVTPRKRPVVPVMSISMRLLNFDFCWCTSSCCKNHCPLPTLRQIASKLGLYCRWSILYVLIVFKSQWKFHLFCPSVDFTWVYWFPSAHDPKSQYLDVYGTLICWINIWRPIIFLVVWQKDQQGRFVFLPCNLTEFHHRFSLSVPPWSLKYAPRQTTRHKQEDIFGAWLMPTGKLLKAIGEQSLELWKRNKYLQSNVIFCVLLFSLTCMI